MTVRRTYLDYNATAPLRPDVRDVILSSLDITGNPSSVHADGRRARVLVENARIKVARLVGGDPQNVIFTSGGTEANQMALSPFWSQAGEKGGNLEPLARLFVTSVEHPSVLSGGSFAPQNIEIVPVHADGVVDVERLGEQLSGFQQDSDGIPFLVSVMLANNETGALQPVDGIARIVHEFGGLVHCDAVQAAGKIPVDIGAMGADLISLSAHKLGGPQGVGALILGDSRLDLSKPLMRGGGQELKRRAGTENIPGIAGFGAAAEAALGDFTTMERIATLRAGLEQEILNFASDAVIFSSEAARLPNTTCFAVPGLNAETQVIALDLADISVSAGSACSSGKVERSAVLEAMGVGPDLSGAAIRVSLGWNSSEQDVGRFFAAWKEIYRRHKVKKAAA